MLAMYPCDQSEINPSPHHALSTLCGAHIHVALALAPVGGADVAQIGVLRASEDFIVARRVVLQQLPPDGLVGSSACVHATERSEAAICGQQLQRPLMSP